MDAGASKLRCSAREADTTTPSRAWHQPGVTTAAPSNANTTCWLTCQPGFESLLFIATNQPSKLLRLNPNRNRGIPLSKVVYFHISQRLCDHAHHFVVTLATAIVSQLLDQIGFWLSCQMWSIGCHGHAHRPMANSAGGGGFGFSSDGVSGIGQAHSKGQQASNHFLHQTFFLQKRRRPAGLRLAGTKARARHGPCAA